MLFCQKKAKPVATIDKSIKNLLKGWRQPLQAHLILKALDCSTTSLDKSLQIFIIRQTPTSPLLTFINPEMKVFLETDEAQEAEQTQQTTKAKKKSKNKKERST